MAQELPAEQDITRLLAGMDICDMDGQKLGTIDRVYRRAAGATVEAARPEIVAVKTGPLGLGGHL